MKLSDYKDEEAMEVLADILEPSIEIFSDPDIKKAYEEKDRVKGVKVAIKNHPKAVMAIMAGLERVPVEEYHCNVISLPKMLMDVINDEELLSFFSYQGQSLAEKDSGFVTENIEETSKEEVDS